MIQKLILLVFFSVAFISCNQPKEVVSQDEQKVNEQKYAPVELVMEMRFKENTMLDVSYTEDVEGSFSAENKQSYALFGGDEMQKFTFQFPEAVSPKKIKIDFKNPKLKGVEIKNISLKQGDKVIDGDYGKYISYWYFSNSTKYDAENMKYQFFENKDGNYIPFILTNKELQSVLETF